MSFTRRIYFRSPSDCRSSWRTGWPLPVLLVVILLIPGLLAHGNNQVVIFESGDRLTGRVLGDDEESVHFDSNSLGEIRIPKERIKRIEVPLSPEPVRIAQVMVESILPLRGPPEQLPEENPALRLQEGEDIAQTESDGLDDPEAPVDTADDSLTAAESIDILPPQEPPPAPTLWQDNLFFQTLDRYNPIAHWDSLLQVGFVLNMGNVDQRDLSLRFQTERTHIPKRMIKVELSWNYGTRKEADDTILRWQDRKRGLYRYRYALTDRSFLQAATRYHSETTQGIAHEFDQTVGLGYTYLDSGRWKGSATPSIGIRYRDAVDGDVGWLGIMSLFQDLEYRVTSTTHIRESLSVDVYPGDGFDSAINFMTSLDNQLSDRLRLSLRYEFTYNGLAGPDVQSDQQVISFAFGTSF